MRDPEARRARLLGACLSIACLACSGAARPEETATRYEGFTQPYRQVELSFPEIGSIASIEVTEGDRVATGQVVARLDGRVLEATLAIAEARAAETGSLASAQALRDRRKLKLDTLLGLKVKGHAHAEEVAQARADLAVAEANLAAAREDLVVADLERKRVLQQIERRILRSPFAATVAEVMKEVSEIVRPQDEPIIRLAEIDRLKLEIHVASGDAARLTPGATMSLDCPDVSGGTAATVELVSPVTDAESGTVRVRLRIDDTANGMRAGIRCTTDLASAHPDRGQPH
jgi:RND family efflux transporter MFP subunit